MKREFDGKTVVVTGAAQGIGLAIARRFAASGAQLALADLNADALAAAASLLEGEGARVVSSAGDLAVEANAKALQTTTHRAFGPAQVLVNCAGGGVILPFLEHTPETLKATIDRNLWTVLWCTRAFLPEMVAQKYGRIIHIGADSVRTGLIDHAAYNAAKGGVHALTSGLAREFAHAGITVNTVSPTTVATPQLAHFQKTKPELAKKFVEHIPLGRPAEMDEVASMVAYIASDEARFVTGQVLSVNGGTVML